MKSIKNIIKETVLKETNSTIKIDESHFFSVLSETKNKKKFFNFLVLLTAIIISIVIIVTSLVFFINDVLLYPNTPTINKEGAIIPERSCNRLSVLFLFNSAERWANTGIQLQEDDVIKISYSGGFHSDIAGVKRAVEANDTLEYKLVTSSSKEKTNEDVRNNLLYNKKDGYFGSVLYVIAGEGGVNDNDRDKIVQINKDKTEKVKQNGTLFLSVNDIYSVTNKDSCFNDNLGEILVLIEINRKVNWYNWRTFWYRWTENEINHYLDENYLQNNFVTMFNLVFCKLWYYTYPLILLFSFPFLKRKGKNIFQKLKKKKQ